MLPISVPSLCVCSSFIPSLLALGPFWALSPSSPDNRQGRFTIRTRNAPSPISKHRNCIDSDANAIHPRIPSFRQHTVAWSTSECNVYKSDVVRMEVLYLYSTLTLMDLSRMRSIHIHIHITWTFPPNSIFVRCSVEMIHTFIIVGLHTPERRKKRKKIS